MKKIPLSILILIIAFSFHSCKNTIVNKMEKKEEVKYLKHFVPDSSQVLEKIAFGSCSNQALDQSYWDVIASKNPDLWIWMGDIIYSDTEDMQEHKKQYDKFKHNRYYQKFIGRVPVIGVWDDHDYGVNDGGAGYPKKEESKEELMDFLDIPANASVRKHEGAYNSYEFGQGHRKVKIYLLDNRYFKDKLEPDTVTVNRYIKNLTGSILGEQQWNWLENEIKNSDASINLFVSGIQIIPDDQPFEKWGDFPNERTRFLKLLERYKPKNPVILSGDRHLAEISEYTYLDFSAQVTEVTSSGLTHSYEGADEKNAYRLGELYDGKNFGMLKITWGGSKVLMTIFIYDIGGKQIIEHGIIGDY
ncbi:MAG TPA: alkaline phosphatase family protein [Saprospiraceae bacterium]|nr:alkaline phosphatase family protein [Saprospiraceae bacterium]